MELFCDYNLLRVRLMKRAETKLENPTDFLKGTDLSFNEAMDSITDMYSDLFKTIDFEEGAITDDNNLNVF